MSYYYYHMEMFVLPRTENDVNTRTIPEITCKYPEYAIDGVT